ncbi:MAG: hypothetical protein A2622_11280 [Bdellovibrionales bacterium RIFCSPHIGHO2_01_FULL_40_29]|nr:MAG: hypothetical protein A2622_11280 [Bdellovibrionales bacterium RIFCSPHIGHO2_01_FULL_40_29]OFZ34532.1 MAG: hypothetical protein A3D17_01545 [Bdellovibrionales bacterium RIFCSPHIGHO2_02_FULL_40_15]
MSDSSPLHIREATSEDSQRLNTFFTSIPITGAIQIKIAREEQFFSFYQRLGLPYKTYLLEDGHELLGTASFLIRELKFKDKILKIAQGCDLRIAPNRKAILSWSKFFLPLLEEIRQIEHCDGFITSINHTESQSMNAFIRPKMRRSEQPAYSLARKYNLVSIHGSYPWQPSLNENITVRPYNSSDKDALIQFISKQLKGHDFAPKELSEDVAAYIQRSFLYSWSQFLIAFSRDKKIIGCVQPISSSLLQDYLPQEYDQQAHNFRQFLKVAQWLQIGRRLTKPYSRSKQQEALHFRMLHFFLFEHAEVQKALLQAAYTTSKQNEFLIYAYEKSDYVKRPPRGSIYAEIPYGLYNIETPDRDALTELTLNNDQPVWLDLIWF